jgi:hypothetical protein
MKVKWNGPSGTTSVEVGAVVGSDVLVHGHVYDLPAELAESLVASHAAWRKVKRRSRRKEVA